MPKLISNQIKQKMREYYKNNPISITDLAKKFGVSSPTAGKICKDIPRWTKAKIFSPNLKEDWFHTIDSEEKAYYLGFFITDGNVCLSKNNLFICSLTQREEDDYILSNWLKLVGSNRQLAKDGRGCSQATVISKTMAEDLAQYGVIPKKTLLTHLPKLPEKFMPALIRGILDGDGNIEAKWYIPPDGRKRFKHKISFCGTKFLMEEINSFLNSKLSLKVSRLPYTYKDRNLSEIQYTNYEDIKKIGEYLYKDATIFLVRKKRLFDLIEERIEKRQQCANQQDCGKVC